MPGRTVLIEVKEVAHEYRLPVGNFGNDQRARMRKRGFAGVDCYVLVYFTPLDAWRLFHIADFDSRTTGSWDFRSVPTQTLESIVEFLFTPVKAQNAQSESPVSDPHA